MLVINNNTYLTIAEADCFINDYYKETDYLRCYWSVLTEDEKEIYLKRSFTELEKLEYSGRKSDYYQKAQFPRIYKNYDGFTVPECVKEAEAENALGIISKEHAAIADKQFSVLQSVGAVKNIKYKRRESADLEQASNVYSGATKKETRLSSARAEKLLRDWLTDTRRF